MELYSLKSGSLNFCFVVVDQKLAEAMSLFLVRPVVRMGGEDV